jgi:hypothetical protein
MICEHCVQWTPRTWEQLRIRQRNVTNNPGPRLYECPNCGGTEYALTDQYIGDHEPGPPYHWHVPKAIWIAGAVMLLIYLAGFYIWINWQ